MAHNWPPFVMTVRDGVVQMTYGLGRHQRAIEAEALPGSAWNRPGNLQVSLGGRTSGRHLRVDNLFFEAK